jgi:hypothetical protein
MERIYISHEVGMANPELHIHGHPLPVSDQELFSIYLTTKTYLECHGHLPKDADAKIENKPAYPELCKGCIHANPPPNMCPFIPLMGYASFGGNMPTKCPKKIENKDPWQHRSKGMRCRTCMWSVMKDAVSDRPVCPGSIESKRVGRCRRHAPTMNGYPVVYEDDWCGDHKLDENKVNL